MSASRRALITILPVLCAAALPISCISAARADTATNYLAASEHLTGGRIGLHACNLTTGRTLSWRADERFVMCSTFKMSLVACVLSRVDKGQEHLNRFIRYSSAQLSSYAPAARQHLAQGGMSVAAMCQAAIEISDNTCANLLLASIGGPAALTRFWRAGGDSVTRLDDTEPRLNFPPPGSPIDTTTPAAMAGNLKRYLLGNTLSPASRTLLTRWMLNCRTGGKLLRAGLPEGWKIADKTGSNGKDALGDIAVAWPAPARPVVICAYTQGGHPRPETLPPILAQIGRIIGEQLA